MATRLPRQSVPRSASDVPSATMPPAARNAPMPGTSSGRGMPTRSLIAMTTPAQSMMHDAAPLPPGRSAWVATTW
eukprot:3174382-Prymnesium_polylepis.1